MDWKLFSDKINQMQDVNKVINVSFFISKQTRVTSLSSLFLRGPLPNLNETFKESSVYKAGCEFFYEWFAVLNICIH